MTVSQLRSTRTTPRPTATRRVRRTTVIVVGLVMALLTGMIAWFLGEPTLTGLALQLHHWQEQAPSWLAVPTASELILAPTLIAVAVTLGIQHVSPVPQRWSRWLVVLTYTAITLRYLIWRSLTTLNLSTPLNGVFSLGLFALELLLLGNILVQMLLLLRQRPDYSKVADRLSQTLADGRYQPTVDVLIPTYNEIPLILKRTIMGCQAMDYPHKTIYMLDDGRRPEMQALAAELGCKYLTRADNRGAKAGNLNHALGQTEGELVVVFDADYIPTQDFLTRTLGFFQDPQVVLVQTPQNFYNSDPVVRNLGLENQVPSEQEYFYRHIQLQRSVASSVYCSGTSFVIRRQALADIGGFETRSLVEDFHTGVKLLARGGKCIFLNEKLSAGLAPENMPDFVQQRLRWARGNLQGFFIDSNPLTIPGLGLLQRLVHLDGLISWWQSWTRLSLLVLPLAYAFLGVIPIRATTAELFFFLLPYYALTVVTFAWFNLRSRSLMFTEIYSLVMLFPQAIAIVQTFLQPYARGFRITPKGTTQQRFTFNWQLAMPLMLIEALLVIAFGQNIATAFQPVHLAGSSTLEDAIQLQGLGLGWFWAGLNILLVGITLLSLIDAPKPDVYDWLDVRRTVKFQVLSDSPRLTARLWWGSTTKLSEGGAEIALTQAGWMPEDIYAQHQTLRLTLLEEQLELQAKVTHVDLDGEFPTLRVAFSAMTTDQHRRLVELLFCRPGQWENVNTPGELACLWLVLKSLVRPRIFCDRKGDLRATSVIKHLHP